MRKICFLIFVLIASLLLSGCIGTIDESAQVTSVPSEYRFAWYVVDEDGKIIPYKEGSNEFEICVEVFNGSPYDCSYSSDGLIKLNDRVLKERFNAETQKTIGEISALINSTEDLTLLNKIEIIETLCDVSDGSVIECKQDLYKIHL